VSPQVGNVFFDCCALSNFAAVRRLDLLEGRYGWRARWVEAVHYEVTRGLSIQPYLSSVAKAAWLGSPLEISGSRATLREIERIRLGLALGQLPDDPLEHLGEAQTLYYIERHEPTGILVTDDRVALDFARRRGLFAIDSPRVLSDCFSNDEIGCPDAYNLLLDMRNQGRGVRVPPDHADVCPK
jgi:hypothetical protein